MKLLLTLLHRIYFVWVALLFTLTLILAFILIMPCQLLPARPALLTTNFLLRWWSILWGLLIGIRFTQKGRSPRQPAETHVIITNHSSFLDTPASYSSLRGAFRTLAKKELTKAPLMGHIFKASGIMVDRSSPESRQESFQRMVDTLKAGTSLLIFPEGTQNRTPEPLQPFYDGAFKAAIAAQVPIYPIITLNARRLMPQAKFLKIRPGRIQQIFLQPIPTTGLTDADTSDLRDRVHALMRQQILSLQAS